MATIDHAWGNTRALPRRRRRPGLAAVYLVLTLWAVTTVYPFVWVVLNSFRPKDEILRDSFSIPAHPTMANYHTAFQKMSIGWAYVNSFVISGTVMLAVLVLGGLAAYGLARYRFRGRGTLRALVYASLMFPAFSTIIPVYGIIRGMNLVNNSLGVILPQIAGNLSFAVVILIANIQSLPVDMEESAYLEGCRIYGVFFRIVVPLLRPAFATVAIFAFLWSYNDLFTQLFFLRYKETYTITRLLNEISSQYGTDYGLMAASVTLVVVPVLAVYVFLQNNIIKGLTAGAIKG